MIRMDRNIMRAHLGMLLRALILGLSFTVVGLIGKGLPPLLLTALRFAIGAIALLPFVWRAPGRMPGPAAFALYGILEDYARLPFSGRCSGQPIGSRRCP